MLCTRYLGQAPCQEECGTGRGSLLSELTPTPVLTKPYLSTFSVESARESRHDSSIHVDTGDPCDFSTPHCSLGILADRAFLGKFISGPYSKSYFSPWSLFILCSQEPSVPGSSYLKAGDWAQRPLKPPSSDLEFSPGSLPSGQRLLRIEAAGNQALHISHESSHLPSSSP